MSKTKSGQQSNKDRSNTMNPNNASQKAAADNHANQLNPNNSRFKGKK